MAAALHHGLTAPVGAATVLKGGWLGTVLLHYPSEMAQNFWTTIWAWTTCFVVTVVVSMLTRRNRTDEELTGLVYSLTPRQPAGHADNRNILIFGCIILLLSLALNLIFW